MKRKYVVYCCTNKLNNKKYIGITCRPLKERIQQHIRESQKKDSETYNTPFKRAIRKYGIDNFEISILEENLNQEEASEKEKYYIKKLKTYFRYAKSQGYNATIGGEFSIIIPKDRVVQLDIYSGKKINVFASVTEAEDLFCRGVWECVHKRTFTANGFCWLYEKEYLTMTDKDLFDYVNICCKRIIQFDLNGNILNIFDGPLDAASKLNISQGNISMVIAKQRCSCNNFVFMYYEDYIKNGFSIKKNNQDRSKPILQLDENKNIIKEYKSATEAANIFNTKVANISSSIKRGTKSAGYYWQYKTPSK